jgi:hypothetical protein
MADEVINGMFRAGGAKFFTEVKIFGKVALDAFYVVVEGLI